MKHTYVIGHKNPDTDSIASAMAYADLKNTLGFKATAKRLGPLNEETKFATKFFNVEAPDVMLDARTKLGEIELDKAITIDVNASCNDAYNLIIQSSTRTLFAMNNYKLAGIVSISDLTSIRLMDQQAREDLLSKTTIDIIAHDIGGTILNKASFYSNGKVAIYDDSNINYGGYIVFTNNKDLLNTIVEKNPALVVYSGETVDDESLLLFSKRNVSLIKTRLSIENLIICIYEAIPVSLIMSTKMITYNADDFIDEVSNKIISTRYRCYPVLTSNGTLIGSISRYHLFNYDKNSFILVDHSSLSQTIDNINQANIVEVIDHHHIGDIQTTVPIDYRNKICGCTCSIIYQMYKENNIIPNAKIAGMMLSAIISDTLYFISNTTTVFDIDAANELASIAGVDINSYARQLLSASVNLTNANINELIQRDLKQYELSGSRVAIAQTNYSKMSDIQLRMNEFKEKLSAFQKARNYDLLVMMFTSVKADGAYFLFFGPKSNVMFNVIETKFDDNSGFDTNIISRKQELVPKLSKELQF